MPRPPLGPKLITLVAAVAAALGAVELTLRLWYPVRGVIIRPHPEWLHEYIPNSRKLYRHPSADGGSLVRVDINSDGRRGPAVGSAGVTKVIVYGDSFMAAEYAPYAETFPARLESLLKAGRSTPLQVIDAGVTGYGPDQSLLRLEADLATVRPQLIVFSVYAGNDFGDLLRNKLFRLDADGSLVARHPSLAPELAEEFAAAGRWPSWQLARAVKSAAQHWTHTETPGLASPAADAGGPLSTRFDRWLAQGQHEYDDSRADDHVRNLFNDGYDALVSLTPSSDGAVAATQLMRAVLARVQAVAARASVPVLLVVIPAPYDAVPDYALKPDRAKYPDYRPEGLTELVDRLARDSGLPFVDLFPDLSGPGAGRFFYSVGNDHWNAAGEEVAADRVFKEIQQRHLLR